MATVPRPRRLLVTVVWLVATVLALAVTWQAVRVVGGRAGAGGAGVLTQAEAAAELARRAPAGPSETPSAEPAATAPATPQASASPGTTGTPTPTTAPTPPSATAEVVRTWTVTGGQVGVACTGTTLTLLYATPADGWTAEITHAGPAEVEVELRRGDAETRVRGTCVDGVPQQTADDGGGHGGDD